MASRGTKRACDSCHRRKVKCHLDNGQPPCKNCVQACLQCTFLAIPQKKGPKGSRARILTELRVNQQLLRRPNGDEEEGAQPLSNAFPFDSSANRGVQGPFARQPGLLPFPVIQACLGFFYNTDNVCGNPYAAQPIVPHDLANTLVQSAGPSHTAYCFTTALCANIIIQCNMKIQPELLTQPQLVETYGGALLKESISVRQVTDYRRNPTDLDVLMPWLYYGCYSTMGQGTPAWLYLKEAIALAEVLDWQDEENRQSSPDGDAIPPSGKKVLYNLLLTSERALAILHHRNITLHAPLPINAPNDAGYYQDELSLNGIVLLAKVYTPFDYSFFRSWNNLGPVMDRTSALHLQRQLESTLHAHYPPVAQIQAPAIKVTILWLRLVVWRLCLSQSWLTGDPANPVLTYTFPIHLAQETLQAIDQFHEELLEVHGGPLMEKLYDIGSGLVDAATTPGSPDAASQLDLIVRFVTSLSRLRKRKDPYYLRLHQKVQQIFPTNVRLPPATYPTQMVSPQSLGVRTVPSNTSSADISPDTPSSSFSFHNPMNPLPAQPGVQLASHSARQSLLSGQSSNFSDLAIYNNPAASQPSQLSYGRQPANISSYEGPLGGGVAQQHYQGDGSGYAAHPMPYDGRGGGPSLDWRGGDNAMGAVQGQSGHMYAQSPAPGGSLGDGYGHHDQS